MGQYHICTTARYFDLHHRWATNVIYGTDIPQLIPGSRQHWKSFSSDLVSFSEPRGLPDLFVTLSAYDYWPHVQSSAPTEEYEDVARDWENRHAVIWFPEVAVMAAEKRFEWVMKIILSSHDGDGTFGVVKDYVWKKEYQRRGAVHWHMLLWYKPGTIPGHCIKAEVPQSSDPNDSMSA